MRNVRCFYIIYALLLVILGALLAAYDKGTLHCMLTLDALRCLPSSYVTISDTFFKYITEVGAYVPYVVAATLLFVRIGDACFLLLSQLGVALIVQPIKHWLRMPRPKVYFEQMLPDVALHQVDGVDMHLWCSFPSGHTATAFAFMLGIALLCHKRWVSLLCVLVAILTGYSRIYLSQHFAADVFAGSIIGVTVTTLIYYIYTQRPMQWQSQSLQALIKTRFAYDKR